jgi:polar amino acid transport system substrate-binding protein
MPDLRLVSLALILLNQLSLCAADVLSVAVEDEAAPWSKKNGTGYANEIVVAAFKAVGIDARLEVMPYARCKSMVINGEIPACFSMSRLPELDATVAFADKPLFVCYADYFENSAAEHVQNDKDIPKGSHIGTVTGYEYPESVYKLKNSGAIALEDAASEELNLKKLADNRVKLAIINHNVMKPPEYLMAKTGTAGKVRYAFRSGTLDSFIAFSRKHQQGMWAREKFDEGFEAIKANGTLKEIEKKWIDRAHEELKNLQTSSAKASSAGESKP